MLISFIGILGTVIGAVYFRKKYNGLGGAGMTLSFGLAEEVVASFTSQGHINNLLATKA